MTIKLPIPWLLCYGNINIIAAVVKRLIYFPSHCMLFQLLSLQVWCSVYFIYTIPKYTKNLTTYIQQYYHYIYIYIYIYVSVCVCVCTCVFTKELYLLDAFILNLWEAHTRKTFWETNKTHTYTESVYSTTRQKLRCKWLHKASVGLLWACLN